MTCRYDSLKVPAKLVRLGNATRIHVYGLHPDTEKQMSVRGRMLVQIATKINRLYDGNSKFQQLECKEGRSQPKGDQQLIHGLSWAMSL